MVMYKRVETPFGRLARICLGIRVTKTVPMTAEEILADKPDNVWQYIDMKEPSDITPADAEKIHFLRELVLRAGRNGHGL